MFKKCLNANPGRQDYREVKFIMGQQRRYMEFDSLRLPDAKFRIHPKCLPMSRTYLGFRCLLWIADPNFAHRHLGT